MNYTGITKSNYVPVEDEESFDALVETHRGENSAYFVIHEDDGEVAIGCDNGPMYVEDDVLDEFLSELGECIGDVMIIRSVGYEGMRWVPDAWQWVVYPSGEWEYEEMRGLNDITAGVDQ